MLTHLSVLGQVVYLSYLPEAFCPQAPSLQHHMRLAQNRQVIDLQNIKVYAALWSNI